MSSFVSQCKTFKEQDIVSILQNIQDEVNKLDGIFANEFRLRLHQSRVAARLVALGSTTKGILKNAEDIKDLLKKPLFE